MDDQGNPLYPINITVDYIISGANWIELQSIANVATGSSIHRPTQGSSWSFH